MVEKRKIKRIAQGGGTFKAITLHLTEFNKLEPPALYFDNRSCIQHMKTMLIIFSKLSNLEPI